MKKFWVTIAFTLFLVAGCAGKAEGVKSIEVDEGGSYYEVTADKLSEMLENKDFVMVNVHIPFEGDIPNTDVSIAYNEIDQHLDLLPQEKDAKIMLYCQSDGMSHIAAKTLVGLGYTNVWHLGGGFNEWVDSGYEFNK